MQRIDFANIKLGLRGFRSAPKLRGDADSLGPGSANLLIDAEGSLRPFRGLEDAGNGSRIMVQLKDTYGGLDDVAAQEAAGSLFSWLAEMLAYVGYGQVSVEGTNITGAIASSLLRVLLKWNGSYTDPRSGPFVVGLNQPSAPTVGVLDNFTGTAPTMDGTYSFKIAWLRNPIDKSRASATSAVIVLRQKAAYLVIPSNPSGTTHLVVFVTKKNQGGLGLHYRLSSANPFTGAEFTIDDIERTLTNLSVTNGSDIVTASSASFTQADVGKRFHPVSAGFSVTNPTTITQVDSSTQIKLSNNVTVSSGSNPRSAKLISYAAEIDRSIALSWQESDLVEETAWIEDFPPPPASHVFPLDDIGVWGVITYADATADTDSTNPGTAIQFSLPNNIGGYNPFHVLYLPEQVVDVLNRKGDSYNFIGCRNFIGVVQSLGYVDRAAPATMSVLFADRGIETPSNWCISRKALYIFASKGGLVRIVEGGGVDEDFAAPVRHYMKDWLQADTVINSYPDEQSIVSANGKEALIYNERDGVWSSPIYLSDFAPGNIISAVAAKGATYITMEDGANRDAYKFDTGTGSHVTGMSHYFNEPAPANAKTIQKVSASFLADNTDNPAYIHIHKNARKVRAFATMNTGNNTVAFSEVFVTDDMVGWYLLVLGAGAGGSPLLGRVTSVLNDQAVTLGTPEEDLNNSVDLDASTDVADAHCIVAYRIFKKSLTIKGEQTIMPMELYLAGFYSWAIGITLLTSGTEAAPLEIDVKGTINGENLWSQVI